MTVVKTLCQDGVTVCATIHSPTSYCFSLFDVLFLLVRGRVVYFGKQGECLGMGNVGVSVGTRQHKCVWPWAWTLAACREQRSAELRWCSRRAGTRPGTSQGGPAHDCRRCGAAQVMWPARAVH